MQETKEREEVTVCMTFDNRIHTKPLIQGIKERLFSFVCDVGKHRMRWDEDYKRCLKLQG